MSNDEYKAKDRKTPYFFKIRSEKGMLYYFGERHSNDPKDPQWDEVKKMWTEFVVDSKGAHQLAVMEGGLRPVEKTETEAILKYGGMGLLGFLAHKESIETISLEPPFDYEVSELEKNFSLNEILCYYFVRQVSQWNRFLNPKPDFETYISRMLKQLKHQIPDLGLSLDELVSTYEKITGKAFDKNDIEFHKDAFNPLRTSTVLNSVSRDSMRIRDEYISVEIARLVNEGNALFVQYGETHAVLQEPYLRELILD